MNNEESKAYLPNIIPAVVVFFLLGGFGVYGYMQIYALTEETKSLKVELASTTALLSLNTNQLSADLTDLHSKTTGLSDSLSSTQQNIDNVKSQVGGVEQSIGSISGTVGTLKKLSEIDPELLKKYSKVYFTNENYVPSQLVNIPAEYIYSTTRSEQYLKEALPFLRKMFVAAKADGVTLYVKSAYRSFENQESLKSSYTVTYGAGTSNSFSADQGYSEHQLGTTVDIITPGLGGELDNFDKTLAYQWLLKNAYRFGFTLSYPENNTYYVFEPWHWRFVGVKLATYLHNNKLNFNSLEQREIDPYLISIFD